MADGFDALFAAMRAELVALDGGDAAAIEAATEAKIVALDAVRAGGRVDARKLDEARALNALASSRVNMMMAAIDRRLAALTGADQRAAAICYGRDGRAAISR